MIREVARRAVSLPRCIRHFSSSPDVQPPSPTALSQYVKRILDRTDQLRRYQENDVFPPSNWQLRNCYLYALLQQPTKTEIDAVEFLEGAKFASECVIRAMHSQDLIDFAGEKAPRPPLADEMEQMFESMCYQVQFLPRVKRLGLGVSSLELRELDFTGVHLSGVSFKRPTRATLKTEEKLLAVGKQAMAQQKQKMKEMGGRPNFAELMSGFRSVKEQLESVEMEPHDGSETLERLQLSTLIHTKQTVEAVSAKTAERIAVKTEVKTLMCFESLVTDPQDVDWQITRMKQYGRVVSRELVDLNAG
ncbi:uncharacterized protein PITG_13651 [Phytophthora infestans T30-4]|uniref:Uncharacterized protein n=1 Tax=Phytophthora infestans (strain T30-4) TaxID=403677 RepID=D0NMH0_PHYIT|nr:uncharacterized protein PITG_13651 [Phytophthora infestans T30-4]EEY60891.1 conserved hypothetical protein [Phytophthora infestans T30-4]|eukprot:XP_002899837.1 conserved hypothetical protein [Phytophthora infestans T30-4]